MWYNKKFKDCGHKIFTHNSIQLANNTKLLWWLRRSFNATEYFILFPLNNYFILLIYRGVVFLNEFLLIQILTSMHFQIRKDNNIGGIREIVDWDYRKDVERERERETVLKIMRFSVFGFLHQEGIFIYPKYLDN